MQEDTNVRAALIESAVSFLTEGELKIPATSIAWENKKFNVPAAGRNWAAVYYMPEIPEPRTIGACGIDRIVGILQIDIKIPIDTGDGVLLAWENKARKIYAAGNYFRKNGESVLVIKSGMSKGMTKNNYYFKALRVYFRADLTRQTTN